MGHSSRPFSLKRCPGRRSYEFRQSWTPKTGTRVHSLRSCQPGRKSVSGFRPKSEKNGPKMDFGPTGRIGKKSPENRKNSPKIGFFPIFGRFFLFSGDFFLIILERPIFDFGRKPETDLLPGRQDRNTFAKTALLRTALLGTPDFYTETLFTARIGIIIRRAP